MSEKFTPQTPEETCEIIFDAFAAETPIEIVGSGSRRLIGRPLDTEYALSTSAFKGVNLYEPDELVLRAGSARPCPS